MATPTSAQQAAETCSQDALIHKITDARDEIIRRIGQGEEFLLPIFERLEDELEKFRRKEDTLTRVRRLAAENAVRKRAA